MGCVIHYHGGPITPLGVAHSAWSGRHAFVSFEYPDQIAFAAEVCQSFALDNGAFSVWRRGATLDIPGYVAWLNEWSRHPGFDWALIPDVIDGTEEENDAMFAHFHQAGGNLLGSVPVWHMHESLTRLARLCRQFPRVALGSSGEWATVGTASWWSRMGAAMDAICDDSGRPPCKLHGLRMLSTDVFTRLPLASADSTNVAQNHARERQTKGLTGTMGALSIIGRIESQTSAAQWNPAFSPTFALELTA